MIEQDVVTGAHQGSALFQRSSRGRTCGTCRFPCSFTTPFLFPDTCGRAGYDSRCFDCDVGGLEPLFKRLLSDGHTSFRCVVSLQLPIFEIPSRVCISGVAHHSLVWYYFGLCKEILEKPNFNGRIRPSALHFVTHRHFDFSSAR